MKKVWKIITKTERGEVVFYIDFERLAFAEVHENWLSLYFEQSSIFFSRENLKNFDEVREEIKRILENL